MVCFCVHLQHNTRVNHQNYSQPAASKFEMSSCFLTSWSHSDFRYAIERQLLINQDVTEHFFHLKRHDFFCQLSLSADFLTFLIYYRSYLRCVADVKILKEYNEPAENVGSENTILYVFISDQRFFPGWNFSFFSESLFILLIQGEMHQKSIFHV